MRWIFENIGFFVFVFIAISMARAIRKAMQQKEAHEATADETEEQRNLRRIREGIRRKIAERRGGAASTEPPPFVTEPPRPAPRAMLPLPTPQLDPFGGPGKRVLAEFERRVQPKVFSPPPVATDVASVVRQEELAEQMRVLEESRLLAKRRAAEIAAMKQADAESETGALVTSRAALLADLREPQSLRRAWVLREVLGAPVALR